MAQGTFRFHQMKGLYSTPVSSPTLWGEISKSTEFRSYPYPDIPPYHIRTLHIRGAWTTPDINQVATEQNWDLYPQFCSVQVYTATTPTWKNQTHTSLIAFKGQNVRNPKVFVGKIGAKRRPRGDPKEGRKGKNILIVKT